MAVCDRSRREPPLRGPARDDQRRAEAVGLVGRVTDEVARVGECGEDAQAGRLAQPEFARQLRESEPETGPGDEMVEDLHDTFGGRRASSGTRQGHSDPRFAAVTATNH